MNLADIKQIGVVGAGTMGHGIAINFALAGYPTLISDVTEAVLKESTARIRRRPRPVRRRELDQQAPR